MLLFVDRCFGLGCVLQLVFRGSEVPCGGERLPFAVGVILPLRLRYILLVSECVESEEFNYLSELPETEKQRTPGSCASSSS